MAHTHRPGLVLHLASAQLLKFGANYTCEQALAVTDEHFFVCIEADTKGGAWVPLYSDPGPGRKLINSAAKQGHPKWTAGNTYYHPEQLWFASHKAVSVAAQKGKDKSSSNSPNTIAVPSLPQRTEFPANKALQPTAQPLPRPGVG